MLIFHCTCGAQGSLGGPRGSPGEALRGPAGSLGGPRGSLGGPWGSSGEQKCLYFIARRPKRRSARVGLSIFFVIRVVKMLMSGLVLGVAGRPVQNADNDTPPPGPTANRWKTHITIPQVSSTIPPPGGGAF